MLSQDFIFLPNFIKMNCMFACLVNQKHKINGLSHKTHINLKSFALLIREFGTCLQKFMAWTKFITL